MLYMFWEEDILSVLLLSVTAYLLQICGYDKYVFQVIQTRGNKPQNCPITCLRGS